MNYIDPDIPMERQIAFLRQSLVHFQLNVFEFLKERFGSEGVEIFKGIIKEGTRQGISRLKGKSFDEIKKLALMPDRILGLRIKQDYSEPDELHYSITECPYLEESRRRGLDMEFCNVIEDVQIEEVSKGLVELTESTRMCRGDSQCTMWMRNPIGR
jgi:hypothetical protein